MHTCIQTNIQKLESGSDTSLLTSQTPGGNPKRAAPNAAGSSERDPAHIYTYIYIEIHIHIKYICICIYTHVHICLYTHIYILHVYVLHVYQFSCFGGGRVCVSVSKG